MNMNNQKGLIPVVIAFIVAVLFVGAVSYFAFVRKSVVSPPSGEVVLPTEPLAPQLPVIEKTEIGGSALILEPSDTSASPLPDISEWRTYRNETCGFEVKYPPTYVERWEMERCPSPAVYDYERPINAIGIATRPGCDGFGDDPPGCQLHGLVVASNQITGGGGTLENVKLGGVDAEKRVVIPEKPRVGGEKGEELIRPDLLEPEAAWILVQTKRNGLWYRYTFYFHMDDRNIAEDTLNKILSTFKFLESGPKATRPTFEILSPNGGERLTTGETTTIRWRSQNLPSGTDKVTITLSNFAAEEIFKTLFTNTPNDGSESWTVPADLPAIIDLEGFPQSVTNGYRINITCTSHPQCDSYSDHSDAPFVIVSIVSQPIE